LRVHVTPAQLVRALGYVEIIVCVTALCAIIVKKQWKDYKALGLFLSVRIASSSILTVIVHFWNSLGKVRAYDLYFYVYWSSYTLESILGLMIIYSIFRLAMAPLKGLQSLGMLVFRWAAAISVAVSLGSAFVPKITGHDYLVAALSQLERTQGILTLCLLLFVCFAIRPMGLSYGSRIFGVSLGLGIISTMTLVQSAWLTHNPKMHATINEVSGVVACATFMLWTSYFALPEPKRRIIVLPTTSPFLRWNQISLALGDAPGFVAVGGVPPELFAPAELEVMRRASLKMVTPFPKSMGA
jgi:hypothetical protein